MRLPPGFRFHPTDVELVLYYLKRKIMARKLHYEAIAEVNIYKYSPWDLPDKSCLRSKDLEWFFFCPREKKYASGARVKRATENGYWKTTGKDRNIYSNEEPVGAVKTLIFHLGHAPHGERTNWVIHEYRILDNKLPEAGVQDSYVLCKVFEKNGLGPRNGAQYGAPFNEDDWADDDDGDVSQNHAISMEAEGPSQTVLMPDKEQSLPLGSGFIDSGNGPFPLVEGGLSSSAVAPTSMVDANETDDEIVRLFSLFADDGDGMFSLFADDGTLLPNGNGLNQDNLSGNGNTKLLPSIEGLDVYNGLPDLDSCPTMNEGRFNFSGSQNTDYHLNMLPEDNSNYIELLDLVPSMDCSDGLTGTHSRLCQASATYSHENMQQLHSGTRFAGMGQYVSSNISEGDNSLDVIQMPDHQLYHGENNLDFLLEQLDNEVYSSQNMERGSHLENRYSRFMECIPAHLPSAAELLALSPCGGSSIHIKAEVTHGAGECTNEALAVMMEGSSSCWCNLLFWKIQLWVVEGLLSLLEFVSDLIIVRCLNDTVPWSSHYYHLNKSLSYSPRQPELVMLNIFSSAIVFQMQTSICYLGVDCYN